MKPFNLEKPERIKEMSAGDYFLHGDVIVERIESLPTDFNEMKDCPDKALAYGEATGHLHQLIHDEPNKIQLRECQKTKIKYLRVVEPVALRHQEHREIMFPPGDYRIGIQQEYDPFEKLSRRVAD